MLAVKTVKQLGSERQVKLGKFPRWGGGVFLKRLKGGNTHPIVVTNFKVKVREVRRECLSAVLLVLNL